MALEVGERIGDYQVVAILGAGGMGKVYKVRNTISERVEAMKVLLPNLQSDPELADRFMREIKVQASLEHPNIAALHTALRIDNQLLMVMEFVEGRSIEDGIQNGPLPIDFALDCISQVLSALSYAHSHGVIHRDIKPANMMVAQGGVVKLMDFGIARMTQEKKLTQTGRTVGSLYYMSPEQIQGANLDARSDLYSLGVSLYEMVTGRRPFQGDSDYSIMAAHLQQQAVPPIQLDPRLPDVLNEIIMMSIAKDPAQRFQSADAFKAAVDGVRRTLSGATAQPAAMAPPRATPFTPPPSGAAVTPPPATGGRRGLYIALGCVLTLAVLGVAALEGPKLFRTSADTSGAGVSPPAQVAPAPEAAPATVSESVPQSAAPPAGSAVEQPGVIPAPAPSAAAAITKPAPIPGRVTHTPVTTQALPPVQRVPALAEPAQPLAQRPPAPPAPVVDTARLQAVAAQQERLMTLASRANAVRTSLSNLQRSQQAQGLGLRGDITASQSRMEYQMDQAEGAVKAGDPAAARRSLDAAEREVDKLENFLGL